jgi:hypothetical protein
MGQEGRGRREKGEGGSKVEGKGGWDKGRKGGRKCMGGETQRRMGEREVYMTSGRNA